MRKEFLYIIAGARGIFRSILDIREGTDSESTIEGIKRDISFKGHTAWILMFSILIASIGLNLNSTAVIIGAMLISPLMGPILGIGLSVGINDFSTLIRSLKNFGIAVSLGLFTSTMYFLLTPLKIEQTELLARTSPTLLDVMIALFGGFAGIIAGSRREKSNVVPGVAIATALMPPLCTAGYGLATFKLQYFFGAFYLFFINSVFISLATFLVVKYLKFPIVSNVDRMKLKKYRLWVGAFLLVTIIPSAVIFYYVIQEARFKIAAEQFIGDKARFKGSELISSKFTYHDTLSKIDLYYIGKEITREKYDYLNNTLENYNLTGSGLIPITRKTVVNIHQEEKNSIDFEKKFQEINQDLRLKVLSDIYEKNELAMKNKDEKIKLLENELFRLKHLDTIPFLQIGKEMQFHFKDIKKFAYAKSVEMSAVNDSIVYDTIPVLMLKFRENLYSSKRKKLLKNSQEWIRLRMNDDRIRVIEYQ